MGASGISIQWAVAAVIFFSVIAFLIAPFSAVFVLAAGAALLLFAATWGKRGQAGEAEGGSTRADAEEMQNRSEGHIAAANESSRTGVADVSARSPDADPVSDSAPGESPARSQ